MSDAPRFAVIGVGSLGKEHARIYSELHRDGLLKFVGVFDTSLESAKRTAEKLKVPVLEKIEDAILAADAMSVVTPTSTHFGVASQLIESGKHVLVEKPMTDDSAQAGILVELARRKNVVLQVGHVERFNPVFNYLKKVAVEPRFIECHRLSPYPARSTDIGVVLDLMIHDLDVLLAFLDRPVVKVEAVGIAVLSRSEDIANARIQFEGGCVANLTASRISAERLRKIRVFSGGSQPAYISLDYRAQEGFVYRLARSEESESSLLKKLLSAKDSTIVSEFAGKRIVREPVPIEKEEPLRLEIKHFAASVRSRDEPLVTGEAGKRALDLGFEITKQIALNLAQKPNLDSHGK